MNRLKRNTGRWGICQVSSRAAAILLTLLLCSCANAGDAAGPTRAGQAEGAGVQTVGERIPSGTGLILVPDYDFDLVGMVSALSARLTRDGKPPLLVVAESSTAKGKTPASLPFPPTGSCMLVTSNPNDREVALLCPAKSTFILRLPREGVLAGLELAKRGWGTCDTVVLAADNDPGAQILAAALATKMAVPYLPVANRNEAKKLTAGLGQLGVKRVMLVVHAARKPPPWKEFIEPEPQVLDHGKALELMVKATGRERVKNLILARVPRKRSKSYSYEPAWLASYLSGVRDSIIVLCDDRSGADAEKAAMQLVSSLKIKPRSVTILGGNELIEDIALNADARLGSYELRIEPCSMFPREGAAGLAVGRLPCLMLSQSSRLMAAGLARERRFSATPPRVLMIANPATEHSRLPLCETVARFNSQDLKNQGVHVDEFYGKPSNDPAIVKASQSAHFIFFQGHVSDQRLFDRGWDLWDGGFVQLTPPAAGGTGDKTPTSAPSSSGISNPDESLLAPNWLRANGSPRRNDGEDRADLEPGENALHSSLAGSPVVFLQSCSSLDPTLAQSIYDRGAVGLIGSVTSIHSASGSSFVKALSDGLTYRKSTVGEALRDARNYFLCLGALKKQRGHKEQAKVYRVALSFRYWGDPELRLNLAQGRPEGGARHPVTAAFRDVDTITIRVPRRRLPEVQADKYRARMFAGSQAAGIVKTSKDKKTRRLMAMYFFRLTRPTGFSEKAFGSLNPAGEKTASAVFLADPFERFVYVVHFPEHEKVGEEITLDFIRKK